MTIANVNPWVGLVPFMVFIWDKSMGDVSKTFVNESTSVDIANFLNGQSYPTKQLYFCPMMYTLPPSDIAQIPEGLQSFVHLKHNLEKSALENGNPILCNDGFKNSSGKYCKIFIWSYCYHKQRDSHAKQPTLEIPFWATTLIHDSRNSQGKEAKKGLKRVKMTSKMEVCKFSFSITWV